MKKLMKRVAASVAAATLCVTMAVSASAATQSEVVETARNLAVPAKNVAELDNYLKSHTDKFTSADYDYMINAMQSTFDANVAPFIGDANTADLSDAELKELYKKIPLANRQAILSDLKAVGTKYGVVITVTPDGNYAYTVTVSEPGTPSTSNTTPNKDTNNGTAIVSKNGGSEKALNTGAGSVAVEAAAVALLAIALGGTVVVSRKSKKAE